MVRLKAQIKMQKKQASNKACFFNWFQVSIIFYVMRPGIPLHHNNHTDLESDQLK